MIRAHRWRTRGCASVLLFAMSLAPRLAGAANAPTTGQKALQGVGAVMEAFGSRAPDKAPEPPDGALPAPNVLYAEVGGNGLVDSLNYERHFPTGPHEWGIALRAGLGGFRWYSLFGARNAFVSVPLALYGISGHGDHHFEYGVGLTPVFALPTTATSSEPRVAPSGLFALTGVPSLGYRYARPRGGFTFRAGAGLLIFIVHDERQPSLLPTAEVSLGYAF